MKTFSEDKMIVNSSSEMKVRRNGLKKEREKKVPKEGGD